MSLTADSASLDGRDGFNDRQERDLRVQLVRRYALFAGLLLALAFGLASVTKRRLEEEAQTAALQRAQTIAHQLNTFSPDAARLPISLDPATWLLVVADGRILAESAGETPIPTDLAWDHWQRNVIRQVTAGETAAGLTAFNSTDPDGNTWLHVYAPTADGEHFVLIQQPTAVAYASSRLIDRAWQVALVMFVISGLFFWWLLSRQVITPLERLEAYSDVIHWHGQIRRDEKAQLNRVARRKDQVGSLARSLMAMETDIQRRFVQLATLLETSRVVAASLDVTRVIDSILDQVQYLFDIERCAVVVLDQRVGVFRIRASRGLSADFVQQLRIDPDAPDSPSMRALRNQSPIQVANTETDLAYAAFRPRARAEGYQSLLAVPLQTKHAPPAVLLLFKPKPYRYSYSELELASSFAHHASIAMENAALHARTDEQLHEQTGRLEAIVESLNDGLILAGADGKLLYCNHQASQWLGIPRREARSQTSDALFQRLLSGVAEPQLAQQQFDEATSGGRSHTFDLLYEPENGRQRDLRIHLFDVTDSQGQLLGRGQLWQDVTRDKELDRMKSALLSTVSHELRMPLATIKGFASTLLASDVEWDAAAQREFLQTISQETDRLALLVKNLLDMSRIEAGMLDMQVESYSLNDVLKEVLAGFAASTTDRLHLQLAADLPPVAMDVSHLGTVIRNLVENAVKYSPLDKPVEVATFYDDGHITFSLRDYGPGIPPELHDKIFDRFFRVDNRLTREVGGTGLGLAICKGLVEAHNGRVWVQAADPGTVFGFTLPVGATDDVYGLSSEVIHAQNPGR